MLRNCDDRDQRVTATLNRQITTSPHSRTIYSHVLSFLQILMTRFDFLVKFFATQHDNYRYTRSRTVEPWYSDRGPVSLSVCLSACKK